ncbi:MAG: LemA family protein [Ignavibacteriaceae bacterium]|nr:LemA family protein [Ignavibacterium sp.]MCC6255470.1 LemA family protein [Ignavibacteriaceae bacterium]HRN26189.1 LemA family protein [Ignavibacteriaceae bacterium]HRP92121.1 LemA family protein [Ignavibacteriaceae bacterium]HRQ53803.1 LemA family protein [Ignavibacteriaceae bacterium]
MPYILIFIAIIVVAVLFFVSIYNSLVGLRNRVKNAFSQIDVQLKRRHDLIPNLIETVKGYMTHERQIMENITKYRSQAMDANTVGEKAAAEGMLSGALGQLRVQVENYPDLKANQNFLALQEELTSTENKISFARQAYNDQVLFFNNKIQMFPSNIVAGMFSFKEEEFFEIEDKTEKAVPKVSFT